MYQLSIFNNGVEKVVHYPSGNQIDPHVGKLPLKEGLSVVDTLSFTLYPNNPGYDNVFELTTRIRIMDLRDNTIRFTGRVLDVNNKMDSNGAVYKDVTCEGAMSFLNDTKLRGTTIYGDTATSFLSQVLSIHNSKVESSRQIQVGNVDITGTISHTCEFKTTLAELISTLETYGGNIRVREVNKVLYMDWLQTFSSNTLEVSLGVNMKDMVTSKDVTSLGTRIVPLGANNLTIESVNNGLDYIEDASAKAIYGVIEKTVEYRDVSDAATLRTNCINDLSDYTQPSYTLTTNALDLSYLTGNKVEQFVLGAPIHLLNRFMGVDATYSIVSLDLDLLSPYNPTLTISKKPITLSNSINDLRNSSVQNDGVYNNVQIGSSYGIRATRSDGKAVTTVNATDGIKIQTYKGTGMVDAFYIDTNGNLKIKTYDDANAAILSELNVNNDKISAVVQTTDGGASWELNQDKFKVAFNKSGSGYTEIGSTGIIIYDGKFKIKNGSNTVFYVNTSGRCTADGGFIVDDSGSTTEIDASGINITNSNGYTGLMTVSSRYDRLEVPDSMYVDNLLAYDIDVKDDLYSEGTFEVDGQSGFYDVGYFGDNLEVAGGLEVHGPKNCLQQTDNYGYRGINAYETAEYYFGDIGDGVIRNGECIVYIDDIFLECINTNMEYQVDIFEYKNRGSITDIERYPNYFVVKGNVDDVQFGWEIKAKRKGYENNRLEQKLESYKINTNNSENTLLENQTIDNTGYLLESSNTNLEDILLEEVV
jgi:phage minor structural protein